MILEQVKVQGFKSYDQEQVLDLTLLNTGFYFVTGINKVDEELEANGTGKSSLFDAISWCNFDKTPTNRREKNFVSLTSKLPCKVELIYREGKNKFVLERCYKPKTLTLDGVSVSQEEVEDLLGLNFESFLHSVYISQFGQQFFRLSAREKLTTIISIFQDKFEKIEKLSKVADIRKKKLDKEIQLIEQDQAYNTGKVETLQDELTKVSIERKETSYEQENSKYKRLLRQLEKSIERYQSKIKVGTNLLHEFETELNEKKESLESYNDTLSQLQEDMRVLKVEESNLISRLDVLEEDRVAFIKALKNEKCPVCLSTINKKILENKIIEIDGRMDAVEDKLDEIKEEKEGITKDRERLDKVYRKVKSELTEITNDINETKVVIDNTRTTLKVVEFDVKDAMNDLEKLQETNLSFKDRIVKLKAQIKELKEEIDICKMECQDAKRFYKVYDYWSLEGSKRVRLLLLQESLQELEISVNDYLNRLGMGNWSIKLELGRETKSKKFKDELSVLVKAPDTKLALPLEDYSGGEQGRLLLAGTLGLMDFIHMRKGITYNFELWDEPIQWLSKQGVEDLLEVLAERAEVFGKKILITNHSNFDASGIFDGIITIVKTKKGSKIR